MNSKTKIPQFNSLCLLIGCKDKFAALSQKDLQNAGKEAGKAITKGM